MKLKDWYAFNKDLCNFGDMNIVVLKRNSLKSDDIIMRTTCKMDDCMRFFGNFEMARFYFDHRFFGELLGSTITVVIWPDEETGGTLAN